MENICLIIPSLQAGGMERVMSELISYFSKKHNVKIHLILYGINRDIFYSLPEGVSIHKPKFEFNNRNRAWSTLKTLVFLREKVQSIKPKVVLSFGEVWNNFVLLALFGLKVPVFVSDRCQPDKSLGRLHNTLRKILYRRAKGVIVQTDQAKGVYTSFLTPPKIHVIGNPIRQISNPERIHKERIILSVGRLIESKHHDKLIEMFVRINLPDWKLIIVGDDALKQNNMVRLKELVRTLGAENMVELAGKKANVESYYLRSKIFAFTSSSEGFPNVIGEALSAGLPVIAFDCVAGTSDMVTDNVHGFLVPLFDYEAFEQKLKLLMERDDLQDKFGIRAKEDIGKFNLKEVGEKYFNCILQNNESTTN